MTARYNQIKLETKRKVIHTRTQHNVIHIAATYRAELIWIQTSHHHTYLPKYDIVFTWLLMGHKAHSSPTKYNFLWLSCEEIVERMERYIRLDWFRAATSEVESRRTHRRWRCTVYLCQFAMQKERHWHRRQSLISNYVGWIKSETIFFCHLLLLLLQIVRWSPKCVCANRWTKSSEYDAFKLYLRRIQIHPTCCSLTIRQGWHIQFSFLAFVKRFRTIATAHRPTNAPEWERANYSVPAYVVILIKNLFILEFSYFGWLMAGVDERYRYSRYVTINGMAAQNKATAM